MLRAIDSSGRDHISLDVHEHHREAYYNLARQDELLCPECHQPLWFKAGESKVYHFSHKDLGKCPLEADSQEIVMARAMIYRLAKAGFGQRVTMEVPFEGVPRRLDILVETEAGQKFGYWLIEGRFKERHHTWQTLMKAGVWVNWIFLAGMMRRNGREQGTLNLTPTERDLKWTSRVSAGYWPCSEGSPFSLNYLDIHAERLISIRALTCIEDPQVYSGAEVSSPLGDIRIFADNGELLHAGELQKVEEAKRRWAAAEVAKKMQQQAEAKLRKETQQRWMKERQVARAAAEAERKASRPSNPDARADEPTAFENAMLRCISCGVVTSEWGVRYPDRETCKCKTCLQARPPRNQH